jgi:hypothetical protein
MIDLSLDHRIILNNEFDAALQELDLLFNTETSELINDPSFGTNFEQFLWQLTPAVDSLKQYINEKINDTYFLSQMDYDVEVNLYKGEIRMIYDVQIHIQDNRGNKTTRKYQFR